MTRKLVGKKANYILRGAVVGFVLEFLYLVGKLYTSKLCFDGPGIGGCISELSIIFSSNLSDVYVTYGYLLGYLLISIIIGAIVGWIYGKIKNRRK